MTLPRVMTTSTLYNSSGKINPEPQQDYEVNEEESVPRRQNNTTKYYQQSVAEYKSDMKMMEIYAQNLLYNMQGTLVAVEQKKHDERHWMPCQWCQLSWH